MLKTNLKIVGAKKNAWGFGLRTTSLQYITKGEAYVYDDPILYYQFKSYVISHKQI